MASSWSSRLRLELPATGEQAGTWGATTNLTLGTLIEDALCGVSNITIGVGDYTLTTANGSADEARRAILNATGSPAAARNVIIPSVQKIYVVVNGCGQTLTIKTASGSGVDIPTGSTQVVWCDGTNVAPVSLAYGSGTLALSGGLSVGGALAVTGQTTLGTSGGSATPAVIFGNTGTGLALQVRGRSSDGTGLVRLLSNDGLTEYARLFSTAAVPLTIGYGASGTTSAVMDTSGNWTLSKNLTVSGTFTASLTGTVTAPNGSLAAPSVRAGAEQSGFYYTTPGYLHVGVAGAASANFRSNGDFTAQGNVFYTSDRRLKRKLRRIRDPLTLLATLAAYHFEKRKLPGVAQIGLMAQDAQAADAALVEVGPDGYLTLNAGGVLALAVGAVNQLAARVERLEARGRG